MRPSSCARQCVKRPVIWANIDDRDRAAPSCEPAARRLLRRGNGGLHGAGRATSRAASGVHGELSPLALAWRRSLSLPTCSVSSEASTTALASGPRRRRRVRPGARKSRPRELQVKSRSGSYRLVFGGVEMGSSTRRRGRCPPCSCCACTRT